MRLLLHPHYCLHIGLVLNELSHELCPAEVQICSVEMPPIERICQIDRSLDDDFGPRRLKETIGMLSLCFHRYQTSAFQPNCKLRAIITFLLNVGCESSMLEIEAEEMSQRTLSGCYNEVFILT